MSKWEINGATPEELEGLKEEYLQTRRGQDGVPFDDAYCLFTIPKQPEDYDGPERYCTSYTAKGRTDVCRSHKKNVDNLDPTAPMKHGLRALQKNVVEDFTEAEQAAYDAIYEGWSDHYDIEDPGSLDTLHSLAVEIVKESRADRVVEDYRDRNDGSDDGLTKVKAVYGPEGGVVGTEDVPNYVLEERRKLRRAIQSMKDDLGITRKHQDKMEVAEEAAGITEVADEMDEAISGDHEYDPEKFEDDETEDEEQ